MFAKLYETTEVGQVLVMLDSSNDEAVPEVKFYFEPPELGVCSVGLKFEDSDSGWDKAEKCFSDIDEEKAINVVREPINKIAQVS